MLRVKRNSDDEPSDGCGECQTSHTEAGHSPSARDPEGPGPAQLRPVPGGARHRRLPGLRTLAGFTDTRAGSEDPAYVCRQRAGSKDPAYVRRRRAGSDPAYVPTYAGGVPGLKTRLAMRKLRPTTSSGRSSAARRAAGFCDTGSCAGFQAPARLPACGRDGAPERLSRSRARSARALP